MLPDIEPLKYERGTLEMAIGTDIAIEKHFATEDIQFNDPYLYVNLRTLVRNIYSAAERVDVTKENLLEALISDIDMVFSVVSASTLTRTSIIFYVCSYNSLNQIVPYELVKEPRTDLQRKYIDIEGSVISTLLKEHESNGLYEVVKYDVKIPGIKRVATIITHTPVDLLSKSEFASLTLLESHTAKLRGPNEWYLKLTGGKTLNRMPLNLVTLSTYGDGVYVSGMGIKSKRAVTALSEEFNWTPITTRDKMKYSLETLSDRPLAQSLLGLLRKNLR